MRAWLLGGLLLCIATAGSAPAAEVVIDNSGPGFTTLSGSWRVGKAGTPWGKDYLFVITVDGEPTAEVEWRPDLPADATYKVEVWYVADRHRSPDAPYTVDHAGGSETVRIDQRANSGQWVSIGQFAFRSGQAGCVRLANNAQRRMVVADAVRFTPLEAQADAPPAASPASGPAPDQPVSTFADDTPEFRGMWITRFEWPDRDPAKAKAKIDTMMTQLAENHFNAAVFQVRGQADTFYPSPHEPWSPLMAPTGADPGWDPLEYALESAHANKIEFHAYINTHVAWQDAKREPPADPGHVFHRHTNAASPETCDWLVHDQDGRPVQYASDNYVWIAPGVPAAQAYIREQVMYVVRRYAVDGVHFDRIRTAGANHSYDPISRARQAPGSEGNPHNLDFGDWTRDQITRMLTDLYAQIMEVRPTVQVSATPVGLYRQERYPRYPDGFHYGYSKCYQDGQAWMAAGALDYIAPQIYWADSDSPPNFSEILPDWVANSAGRHVYVGLTASMSPREIVRQVRFTREVGGQGSIMFHHGRFASKQYFELFTQAGAPYAKTVPTPPMPWKDAPTEGIIIGTVTRDDDGEPVVDAQITRTDSEYVALSSADGLYSMLKVPPGTYTLTCRKQGLPEWQVADVRITAGQVTRVNMALGAVVAAAPPPEPEPTVLAGSPEEPEPTAITSPTEPGRPAASHQTPSAESTDTPAPKPEATASPAPSETTEEPHDTPKPSTTSRVVTIILFVLLIAAVGAAVAVAIFHFVLDRDKTS